MRRVDYIYDGFRNPVCAIGGDSYRALLGINTRSVEEEDRMEPWDREDDDLIINMGPDETFRDIADMCCCTDAAVKYAYQRLLREGRVQKRPLVKDAYTHKEVEIVQTIDKNGMRHIMELLPNRSSVSLAGKARSLGFSYDVKQKKWYRREQIEVVQA